MKTFLRLTHFLGMIPLALAASSLQAQTIVDTTIVSTGSFQYVDGNTNGLSTNLTGHNWAAGAGWGYSDGPSIPATWMAPDPINQLNLGDERQALGISLASDVGYVKPTSFTISASLSFSGTHDNTGLLGFWSSMPAKGLPDTGSGATAGDPYENFTGLVLSEVGGTLQIYSGGILQGSPLATGVIILENSFYTLSYTVDTATGAISGVNLAGNAISGLTSTAFTDSATTFAGMGSGFNSRLAINDFTVSVPVPEPSTYALFLGGAILLVGMRRSQLKKA